MKRTLVLSFFILGCLSLFRAQTQLLDDFSVQLVTDQISKPNGLIFDHDGKMIVWEKIGLAWLVEDGVVNSEPLLDIREEVASYGDLGLLSIALDPNYKDNGYIYAYYIVDYHHLLNYGTPSYDPMKSESNKATIGRVTRFQIKDEVFLPDSRHILLGKTKENGVPVMHTSHVGGTLLFADDGTLLLSTGDGETWEGNYVGDGPPFYNSKVPQGLEDGIIRPEEEVGVMRCQMINSYSGKVLRIDPVTGLGLSSNPYYDPAHPDQPASKVWALGLRNPFRMSFRTGSGSKSPENGLPGTIYVGEVGAAKWEELNIITKPGLNFGWPIIEGNDYSDLYDLVQTNKDVLSPCSNEPIPFRDLVKLPHGKKVEFPDPCDPSLQISEELTYICELPALNLAHITVGLGVFTHTFDEDGELHNIRIEDERSTIAGDVGLIRSNAAITGPVYQGDHFPPEFQGDLFITDYSNGWIARVETDLNEKVTGIYKFYSDTFKIKHLEESPKDGCLYIVENKGVIKKICYNVNVPPIVKVNVSSDYGPSPLYVEFDASDSRDPERTSLTYEWDFGDGRKAEGKQVSHTFNSNDIKEFEVALTVSDEDGLSSTENIPIFVNNTPPKVRILGVADDDLYSLAGINWYSLTADVSDEESNTELLDFKWSYYLHHNSHYHLEEEEKGQEYQVELAPVGCEDEIFYYRVRLDVTDPQGLGSHDEVFLYPDCEDVFANLKLFVGVQTDGGNLLEWETEQESDLDYIEVLRKDLDGSFKVIHTVQASGEASHYSYLDDSSPSGSNVYRLKLVGKKGNFAFSQEVVLIYVSEGDVLVFPNPAINEFNLYFEEGNTIANVELYDMGGRFIESFELTLVGQKKARIVPKALQTSGNYTVVIKLQDHTVRKIVHLVVR